MTEPTTLSDDDWRDIAYLISVKIGAAGHAGKPALAMKYSALLNKVREQAAARQQADAAPVYVDGMRCAKCESTNLQPDLIGGGTYDCNDCKTNLQSVSQLLPPARRQSDAPNAAALEKEEEIFANMQARRKAARAEEARQQADAALWDAHGQTHGDHRSVMIPVTEGKPKADAAPADPPDPNETARDHRIGPYDDTSGSRKAQER